MESQNQNRGMSNGRTIAVFALIFGCFAVLYPRIFHPIVMRAVGGSSNTDTEQDLHPQNVDGKTPPGKRPDVQKPDPETRNHIRPGGHPGLRASSEIRNQQPQGSGRGMMAIVLPMYAVGIVLYLVYTLVKVFSKRDQNSRESPSSLTHQLHGYQDELSSQLRGLQTNYDNRDGKFTYGDDLTEGESYHDFLSKRQKQEELESLLLKADQRHITEHEMTQLQQRLQETESQMVRIMQAMGTMQQNMGGLVDNLGMQENTSISDITSVAHEEQKQQDEQIDTTINKTADDALSTAAENHESSKHMHIPDISPDTDSYELVDSLNGVSPISTPASDESAQLSSDSLDAHELVMTTEAEHEKQIDENQSGNSSITELSSAADESEDVPETLDIVLDNEVRDSCDDDRDNEDVLLRRRKKADDADN